LPKLRRRTTTHEVGALEVQLLEQLVDPSVEPSST
jgi:hypothetical protein